MPTAAPAATDSRELLLGLRYYSAETSHFVFRPEQLPKRALEMGVTTVLLTLILFYTCAEGEEEDGGVVWDDMPSLSRAGSTLPASIPFALGIPCTALLVALAFWLVYATHAKKLAWSSARRVPEEHIQATCWSRRCLHVGWCFCVFLAAAAAVPVTFSPAMHASLVGAMFGSGLLYASLLLGCVLRPAHKLFLATAEDERNYRRKWRCAVGVGVALVLDGCVLVVAAWVPGVDCPWPRPCWVRVAQGGLEALAAVGLMGFVHSLGYDLRDVQLELSI